MQDEHEDERYEEQAKERQGCEGEERERYENQRLREVEGYEVEAEDNTPETVECPYCDEGMANPEDKCRWCKGTGWISEEMV